MGMYSFFALVSRLKNIDRWALMRNADRENVQEHSHMVAVIAHALGLIRRNIFKIECDPDRAAAAALFHDAPEILTGDMPTPVKYHDENMIEAYRRIEDAAVDKLVSSLPEELSWEYRKLLKIPEDVADLVHAADKIAAYIKCLEELKTGNGEFKSAADSTLSKLKKLKMPEVDYFIENFIPAFSLTLDELGL